MHDNFINPNTKKTFRVSGFRSKYNGGNMWYLDKKGNRLTDEDGTILEPIGYEGDVQTAAIKTPTKNRV